MTELSELTVSPFRCFPINKMTSIDDRNALLLLDEFFDSAVSEEELVLDDFFDSAVSEEEHRRWENEPYNRTKEQTEITAASCDAFPKPKKIRRTIPGHSILDDADLP